MSIIFHDEYHQQIINRSSTDHHGSGQAFMLMQYWHEAQTIPPFPTPLWQLAFGGAHDLCSKLPLAEIRRWPREDYGSGYEWIWYCTVLYDHAWWIKFLRLKSEEGLDLHSSIISFNLSACPTKCLIIFWFKLPHYEIVNNMILWHSNGEASSSTLNIAHLELIRTRKPHSLQTGLLVP